MAMAVDASDAKEAIRWTIHQHALFTMSDLYEAEEARRESEERLTATYEAATIAIAEADHTGHLLRMNDAHCKMLGRSREQLLAMTFFAADNYADSRLITPANMLFHKTRRGD